MSKPQQQEQQEQEDNKGQLGWQSAGWQRCPEQCLYIVVLELSRASGGFLSGCFVPCCWAMATDNAMASCHAIGASKVAALHCNAGPSQGG